MPWTNRLLVVANRTLESDELLAHLRDRAAEGAVQVTLVAPAGPWEHAAASERVARVVDTLRAEGVEAEGDVGDAEPCTAVLDVYDPRRFDEIVVCTLPNATSRWLAIDLPHRLRRVTNARVRHVPASERRVEAPVTKLEPPTHPQPAWFERLFPVHPSNH